MKVYLKAFAQGAFRTLSPPKVLTDLPVIPISEKFGLERGIPIDRFYIEKFLCAHSKFIKGCVVEIAENTYTIKFGKGVKKSEILHIDPEFKVATILADLANTEAMPENLAEAFICTQTLNFIFDVKAAIKSIYKILKPGGKALITVAGLSQISRFDMDKWGDYWRFTDKSLNRLLIEVFGEKHVAVQTFGNVFSATMLLQGIALEEVDEQKVDFIDSNYQVIIGAVVTKPITLNGQAKNLNDSPHFCELP